MNKLLKYNFNKVALWGSLFIFLFACSFSQNKKICQIGEYVLYEDELTFRKKMLSSELNEQEVTQIVIEQWINEQAIKIETNELLPEINKINKLRMEEYLMKLNMFELENLYIKDNLDTVVNESAIQIFYNSHRENYKTKSYIVRALYIRISDTMAKVLNMDERYLLKNSKDIEEIKKYANIYAANFYFEDERWIFFDDLVRGVPISPEQKNKIVENKIATKFNDNGETYYINVLDYKLKTVSSPLEVERDRIKKHILTQRTNDLRSHARKKILENVKEKYPVTYF